MYATINLTLRQSCNPDEIPDFPVADCERVFTTKSGGTLYCKRFHPERHNKELEAKDRHRSEPASNLEVYNIARDELSYGGFYVNEFLDKKFNRRSNWIKNFRRSARYQSLREKLGGDVEKACTDGALPSPSLDCTSGLPSPFVSDDVLLSGPATPPADASPAIANDGTMSSGAPPPGPPSPSISDGVFLSGPASPPADASPCIADDDDTMPSGAPSSGPLLSLMLPPWLIAFVNIFFVFWKMRRVRLRWLIGHS